MSRSGRGDPEAVAVALTTIDSQWMHSAEIEDAVSDFRRLMTTIHDRDGHGATTLHFGALNGHVDLVRTLLQLGINSGNPEVVRVLSARSSTTFSK